MRRPDEAKRGAVAPALERRLEAPTGIGPRLAGRMLLDRPTEDRAHQHERAGPLRIGCREDGGHRASLREPHERRPLGAGRVHHRPHVLHALLKGCGPGIGSESPVPRLSKRISREKEASRS